MSNLVVRKRPDVEVGGEVRSSVLHTPRFDLWENENEFVLHGDLPGVTPEGLDIQFENGELRMWGKVEPRSANARYWAAEYGVGDFYRTVALGEMIDGESITAELKQGVLTVHLPKKAEARPRRITVTAG